MNIKQLVTALKAVLVGAGPSFVALAPTLGWAPSEVEKWIAAAISVIGIVLLILDKTETAIVADAAALPPEKATRALAAIPDAAKVKAANAVPDVATVVLKDSVQDKGLQKLASSGEFPDVVTETQNEYDAKLGTKVSVPEEPPGNGNTYKTLK